MYKNEIITFLTKITRQLNLNKETHDNFYLNKRKEN